MASNSTLPVAAGLLSSAKGPEVEIDDVGIVEQLTAGPGVGVLALVHHITAVADLEATSGVLLNHDDRDAAITDLSNSIEYQVLICRRQPS